MTTVVSSNRSDSMSSYSMDINSSTMQSPTSEYSYSQPMSSGASGIFPFSQTGPSPDLSGSAWDTTTVEGPQNFFADQGDAEDYSFTMGHFSGRSHMDATDDFQSTWMPAAAAAGGDKTHKAEPMRRISSKGSANGHRISKASSSKSRPRIQAAALPQGISQVSNFDFTGNASTLDPSQYMFQQPRGISTSPEMLYSRIDGLPTAGLAFNDFITAQHVDPSNIPLDFETSMSGGSPESWDNLSEVTTPPKDDAWGMVMHQSPLTSVASDSPTIQALDSFSLVGPTQPMMSTSELEASMSTVVADDQVSLNGWTARRAVSDGETARDHPLYKNVCPQDDGLFHCPWEGNANCNHKPEKLKCNYDKFVDSHLKPYRCKVESCENARFSSTACLLRHEREAHAMHGHGDKPYLCTYEACDRAVPGNGFPRNWNLRDHMRRVHNDDGKSLSARSGPSSPGGSSQKEASKSRKRKSDPSGKSSSGRKSPKSSPVAPVKIDASAKLREEWFAVQAGLSGVLNGFPQPEDPMVMDHIARAKDTLDSMARIHADLMSTKNNSMGYQRFNPYGQQSG